MALAVVRDNELYVCTVGPAEAYLNRGARLSTLPDPHRDRGLPSSEVEPDVWRGEINVGDQLLLVSPTIVAALGADALKDALVTLHPQSAVEALTARFRDGGGAGSDGALVIEAAEIAATRGGVVPVPVRPAEPLAGTPDRSPIPLADSVVGGIAAAQSGARRARGAAGGVLYRVLTRVQDALPSRGVRNRRVTPLSAAARCSAVRRWRCCRCGRVVGGLGDRLRAASAGGAERPGDRRRSIRRRARSSSRAPTSVASSGRGSTSSLNDPPRAEELLTEAYAALEDGREGEPPDIDHRAPPDADRRRARPAVRDGRRQLDRRSSRSRATPAVDLKALVRGPDGAPFVLDAATEDRLPDRPRGSQGDRHLPRGQQGGRRHRGARRSCSPSAAATCSWSTRRTSSGAGGPPTPTGKGTITRVRVSGATEWGDDILAIGTFIRNSEANLYNFYVVDPSAQQILRYSPAADGSGFPAQPNP